MKKSHILRLLGLVIVLTCAILVYVYFICSPDACAEPPQETKTTQDPAHTDTALANDLAQLAQAQPSERGSIIDAVCGNGHRELTEQCDDGNTVKGDGCSANCALEDEDRPGSHDRCDDDAKIGDIIWHDKNENGVQEPLEHGISGVTVKVVDGNDKKYQTTDAHGRYQFTNLCNKVTVIVAAETLPQGCYQTYDRDGTLDHSYKRELGDDDSYTKADFGYKCPTFTSAENRISPATGTPLNIYILSSIIFAGLAVLTFKKWVR